MDIQQSNKKKEKNSLMALIFGGIGILMVIAFIGSGLSKQPEKQIATTVTSENQSKPVDTTMPSNTNSTSNNAKPADTSAPKKIPGLGSGDIKEGLQSTWKLIFTGPQVSQEIYADHGKVLDPDTGCQLHCDIYGQSPSSIEFIVFEVDGSSVAGTISTSTFNSLCEGYLGLCATLPYDGADQDKAKEWVKQNVSKATKQGSALSMDIGQVKFELYGTNYVKYLKVKVI